MLELEDWYLVLRGLYFTWQMLLVPYRLLP
jgi:hypothetical protein